MPKSTEAKRLYVQYLALVRHAGNVTFGYLKTLPGWIRGVLVRSPRMLAGFLSQLSQPPIPNTGSAHTRSDQTVRGEESADRGRKAA